MKLDELDLANDIALLPHNHQQIEKVRAESSCNRPPHKPTEVHSSQGQNQDTSDLDSKPTTTREGLINLPGKLGRLKDHKNKCSCPN